MVVDVRWALCSHVEVLMAGALLFVDGIVCGWQGNGKRAAPFVQVQGRCHAGAAETH